MHPIGVAARMSGVNIETIRYYEREGVVPAPERSGSGRRLYDRAAIARLRFIRRCRDLGFPVADIRALLALTEEAETPCAEARGIGEKQLALVRAKLRDLRSMESGLARLLRECDSGTQECTMLRILFAD
jgi:MerR family mercuric resistance operon transcriptional regulator